MNKYNIIPIFIVTVLLASCSSSNKLKRAEEKARKAEEVQQLIDNHRFIVKADRADLRRGGHILLDGRRNYIIVDGDMVRMSLAYVGRSHDYRGIAGINMAGKIIEKNISQKKNGTMYEFNVKQNNDSFRVNILISKSGICDLNVYNAKLDPASYKGQINSLN